MSVKTTLRVTGGPLFTKTEEGEWVQLGLVSWGPSNEDKDVTLWDVNSDISYYKTWINDNIAALVLLISDQKLSTFSA
mgnify:CR=1 FL=1